MSDGAQLVLGEGGGEVAISRNEGMVVIAVRENATGRFASVKMNPEVALQAGEQMAKDAYRALYNTDPPTHALKDAVIEKKRQKLLARLPIILRQLRERKKPDLYVAEEMFDLVAKELLQ